MICKYCGSDVADNLQFCPNCGGDLTAPEAQSSPQSAPPQFNEQNSGQSPVFTGAPGNPYGQTFQPEDTSGKATTGMILGIISLIAWCLPIAGLPVSIVGIIFSNNGRTSEKSTQATVGLVLSIIGLVLSIINAVAGVFLNTANLLIN